MGSSSVQNDAEFLLLIGRLGVTNIQSKTLERDFISGFTSLADVNRELFTALLSIKYRLLSPQAQDFVRTAVRNSFSKDERTFFVSKNSFCLSSSDVEYVTEGNSFETRISLAEDMLNSWRAGEGGIDPSMLKDLESDLIDSGRLDEMLRFHALPFETSPGFDKKIINKLEKSGQITSLYDEEIGAAYRVLTEDAYFFFSKEFAKAPFDGMAAVDGIPNIELSNFYLEQPFGILVIHSPTDRSFMYMSVTDKLYSNNGDEIDSLVLVNNRDDRKSILYALSNEGAYSFIAKHPRFTPKMMQPISDERNPINALFSLANNPAYASYFKSDETGSTKDLLVNLEMRLKETLYDCLRSPCRNYYPLFGRLQSEVERIKDPITFKQASGSCFKVAMESPSRLVRGAALKFFTPTVENIARLESIAKCDEDISTRAMATEKLLSLRTGADMGLFVDEEQVDGWLDKLNGVPLAQLLNSLELELKTNDDVAVYSTMSTCPALAKALRSSVAQPGGVNNAKTPSRGFGVS